MRRHILRSLVVTGLALLGSATAADAVAQDQASLRITDAGVAEAGVGRATFNARLWGTHGAVTVAFSTSTNGGIDDVTVTEGAGHNATFAVSLSAASGNSVTVSFLTGGATATGGTCAASGFDYRANPSPLTIAPGQPSGTLAVPICDDVVREGNESFQVGLTGATNATIQDNVGVATITDDEPLPALSITRGVDTKEGLDAVFVVHLGGPQTIQTVSVHFATGPGTATTGACPGRTPLPLGDYVAQTGTLTFTPSVTSQQIVVPICSDRVSDPDEVFTVTLSTPVNARIANATGAATIK